MRAPMMKRSHAVEFKRSWRYVICGDVIIIIARIVDHIDLAIRNERVEDVVLLQIILQLRITHEAAEVAFAIAALIEVVHAESDETALIFVRNGATSAL